MTFNIVKFKHMVGWIKALHVSHEKQIKTAVNCQLTFRALLTQNISKTTKNIKIIESIFFAGNSNLYIKVL